MLSSSEPSEVVSTTATFNNDIADDARTETGETGILPSLSNNVVIFAAASTSDSASDTTSSNSTQDQQQGPQPLPLTTTTTTTDIPLESEGHPRQWTNDEVLHWFQANKLDDLYDSLFPSNQPKDGTTLDTIFKLKTDNYDKYRAEYSKKLQGSNKDNLLKDFDQFGQLLDNLFIDKYAYRFDVAFSFPGDIREQVRRIADKLCTKINRRQGEQRVFYDKYHKVELARPNLDLYLQSIYRFQSKLIVVFMCAPYKIKEWCGLEERAIRSLLKARQSSRIMLISVDGKTIEGISDIDGYWDIQNEDEDDVVEGIYKRFKDLGEPVSWSHALHLPLPDNVISKMAVTAMNVVRSIPPWYIIVALLSYILGTFSGR